MNEPLELAWIVEPRDLPRVSRLWLGFEALLLGVAVIAGLLLVTRSVDQSLDLWLLAAVVVVLPGGLRGLWRLLRLHRLRALIGSAVTWTIADDGVRMTRDGRPAAVRPWSDLVGAQGTSTHVVLIDRHGRQFAVPKRVFADPAAGAAFEAAVRGHLATVTYTPSFRRRLVLVAVVLVGLLALIWVAGWVAGPPMLSAVPVQGGWEVPGPPLPSGRHVNDGSTADALESVVRDGLTASGTHLLPGGPIRPTDILAYPNAWVLFQQRLVLPGAPSADPVSEVTMPLGAYFATGSTRVGVTFGTTPGVTYAYDLDPAAMARLADLIYPTGETPVFIVGWAIIALVGVAAAAAVIRGWRLDRARRARSP